MRHNMKNKIVYLITVCVMALSSTARAVEGGMGHYAPGEYLDFCGVPPAEPGLYAINYFLDYGNGKISGSRQLPLGGVFGAGATVNLQAEGPGIIYAYPFNLKHITFSSGIYPSWVWANVNVTATYDRNHVQLSG